MLKKVLIIVVIVAIGFFVYSNINSFQNQTVTADNIEEINNNVFDELDEDDAYYFLYAELYYMMTDGLSSLSLTSTEEEMEEQMYQNIYGKKVKELISEGKQLMEDNDITIEEYKETLQEFAEDYS